MGDFLWVYWRRKKGDRGGVKVGKFSDKVGVYVCVFSVCVCVCLWRSKEEKGESKGNLKLMKRTLVGFCFYYERKLKNKNKKIVVWLV